MRNETDLPFEMGEDDSGPERTLVSNVLVVDDEPVVRDVFSRLLARESDVVTVVAESAEQAIANIRNQRFDVLVTDKNLPGTGGIELIAQARSMRPGLEAIMITGYPSPESVIAALAAGASDYLVKPFDDLQVVRAKIRAALNRKMQRTLQRERARGVARQAAELLSQGKDAPEPAWQKLEKKFAEYERTIRGGAKGSVLVIGSERPVQVLVHSGVPAQPVHENSPLLRMADVVVIETGRNDWRPLADKLARAGPDLVLLASSQSDLPDLLEALSLRMELVGFGGAIPTKTLPERVKVLLLRRAVERSQTDLANALDEFRQILTEPEQAAPQ